MYGMGDTPVVGTVISNDPVPILTPGPALPISPFAGSQQPLLLADTIAANAPSSAQVLQYGGISAWLAQNMTTVYLAGGALFLMAMFSGGRRR